MSDERTHDEFCFYTDLYEDEPGSPMCICNRLTSARHQAVLDAQNAPAVYHLIREADHLAEKAEWERYTARCEYKATGDERKRIVWLIGTFAHGALGDCDCQLCVTLYRLSVAIKGDSDA